MSFFGREEQLTKLHRFFSHQNTMLALIYGRRRVGKSELIKQSLRQSEYDNIYYECKQTTELNNVESLAALLSEKYGYPRLSFNGIEEILEFLFQKSAQHTLILTLDEYPYLRQSVKGLDSILQTLVDRYSGRSALKIILCGSFVDIMKSLLLAENPLYGRVDLTIDLKPMDYYEAACFYPGFSDEDKVRLYSVFGGIPYFNKLIDSSLSVRENIIELVASPGSRLENEVLFYLRSEIAKLANANEVFEALAKGYAKYSDLLAQSHVSSAPTMLDVLEKLIRMEIVTREAPINDARNRRRASYHIIDNLSLFYYRYIFRFASQLNVMAPQDFYERYIAQDFESYYVPRIFEAIGRQYLIRQNRAGRLPVVFEQIGKYYYDDPKTKSNGEFDIVTLDPEGYVFYEAKFRKEPLSRAAIEQEIRQVQATGLNCYQYGFISRSGFSCAPDKNMRFITLAELYAPA